MTIASARDPLGGVDQQALVEFRYRAVCEVLGVGVQLAEGRQCKLVTGIDDHSRFVVIAAVVVVANGRAVCEAFTAAMRR